MTKADVHNRQPIPGVKDMVAVSSGKGGVGKSTVATNLAVAMAAEGAAVGLIDADIYGPNVPGMLGLEGRPAVDPGSNRIKPAGAHGIKAISMGMLIDPGVPVIWRGPMLAKMMNQFLFQVDWGDIDVMLLDLPPGTGDVQITLTQTAPLTGAVIVTTSSEIAMEDVRRGVAMFRQTDVPLLGLIENMCEFACDHCGHRANLFGEGGGSKLAGAFGIDLLAQLPLDPRIGRCSDEGTPFAAARRGDPTSELFSEAARSLMERLGNRRDSGAG
jgi:ATP-binding protein involved in chromosome partitioning